MTDRRIAGVSLHGWERVLLVRVQDGSGASGWAETPADSEVNGRILAAAARLLGADPWSADPRWRTRPGGPGPEWLAFAALDAACFDLAAGRAGLALRDWLGGTARDQVTWQGGDQPASDVAPGAFERLLEVIDRSDTGSVILDPRRWGVGALVRLDGWCRVRQVEIGLEAPGSGPIGLALAEELAAALPMATLGVRRDEPAGGDLARSAFERKVSAEAPLAMVGGVA